MTLKEKHAEVSLLFIGHTAPLAAVDAIALRSTLNALGFPVCRVDALAGDFIQLACDSVQILVAGFDRPFPMEHFHSVLRAREEDAESKEVLSLLAGHRSSLTVLVVDPADKPNETDFATKERICRETVDLLLANTAPDLVFWRNEDRLDTAAEAEAALEAATAQPDNIERVQPQTPTIMATPQAMCPAGCPQPVRAGNIDLDATEYLTDAFTIRPKRPARSSRRTERPPHLTVEPRLSADVVKWFDGNDDVPVCADTCAGKSGLRSFLALDDSGEVRRIADTASGRASLYLMSATIAVFALPVGASMLTYNALSGGSFRATSHVMALTGMFLALAAAGMPNPAAALTIGF